MPDSVSQQPDRVELASLWTRIEQFCIDRGWNAELYVREDDEQFGRIGAKVDQGFGHSFRAFGNTTNAAIRNLVMSLEREGFDA